VNELRISYVCSKPNTYYTSSRLLYLVANKIEPHGLLFDHTMVQLHQPSFKDIRVHLMDKFRFNSLSEMMLFKLSLDQKELQEKLLDYDGKMTGMTWVTN
jgi:hypothetical protein